MPFRYSSWFRNCNNVDMMNDGLVWIISIPIKCNDSVKNTGACTLSLTHTDYHANIVNMYEKNAEI